MTKLTARDVKRFTTAFSEECTRQKRHLRLPGYPRPYYLSYLMRDISSLSIWGRLGALNELSNRRRRNVYCDVRVGSYRFDQVTEGGLDDHDSEADSYDHIDMPITNDIDAFKFHLWKLTDSRYREAVRDYLSRKSSNVTYVDPNSDLPSYRRAKPHTYANYRAPRAPDEAYWRDYVIKSSRLVKRYPQVKNSWVDLRVRDISRIFVSSEGTKLIDQTRICELSCELWLLADNGEGVSTRVSHITPRIEDLPELPEFKRAIREKIKLLLALKDAPTLKSYAGPVLLAPGPAGILFHEVLGHRLEGSRLLSNREGQTFARDLGKQILPKNFTVIDDPTQRKVAGVHTIGSYRYDDEGSKAEPVVLIKNGKLATFLAGRQPISKRHRGNGHARAEYHERPISRMGNLIIEATGGVSHDTLRDMLLAEVERQGLPYGILVLDAEGGETATESYDFQAFMGQISVAVQVWADGRENLIRNVSFVGTPLTALRNILAIGDTPKCENAFCGAESGVVPVSTTCPALLLSNLELQASDQRKYAPYILPMPHDV